MKGPLPLPRYEVNAAHPRNGTIHRRHVQTETQARRVAKTANGRGYEVWVNVEEDGSRINPRTGELEPCLTSRQVLALAAPIIRPPWHGGTR